MNFIFRETEEEEYNRLLSKRKKEAKEAKEAQECRERYMHNIIDKGRERERKERERKEYLEAKFNPKKDKISILQPDQQKCRNIMKDKFEKERKNKFEEIIKKYSNISFEEAILRSHKLTSVYYEDEYFIKIFKQLSPPKSPPKPKSPSPPKPKPKSSLLKPKPKSPPKPKSRSSLDPTDPNYALEMAFRNLEKKQASKSKSKNRDLRNDELEKLFKRK
jgi:hypothetical protein